ncbi:MAG: twin-arginine translocase TatA/TatE family subunit [Armatimonadetes bacterium]|nr:twin-arginine translocase TatA/TatE family subunit [Armatimonadota bacterium]
METMFAFLQMNEVLVIGIVVLLLFGGSKIPQLMRGLGRGMGEFQKGIEEGKRALEKAKIETMAAGAEDEKPGEEPKPQEN